MFALHSIVFQTDQTCSWPFLCPVDGQVLAIGKGLDEEVIALWDEPEVFIGVSAILLKHDHSGCFIIVGKGEHFFGFLGYDAAGDGLCLMALLAD